LVNWDHIQLWQKPAEQRRVQQCSASEKVDCSIARSARKRRIEVTLMIHCENRRPALNHALTMNYAKPKKKPAGEKKKVITKPVIEIHLKMSRFLELAIFPPKFESLKL